MTKPVLVFGWGNPSRGDDALGPLFVERIEALKLPEVECLTDFQLQVEHALDLKGRQQVLFVDASRTAAAPFEATGLTPTRDASFTTHSMTPAALLHAYREVFGEEPPPARLLGIRGECWELGAAPSGNAAANLAKALDWAFDWLNVR